MGEVTLFREFNYIWYLNKWSVYVDGKKIKKIGNNKIITFYLPIGEHQIIVKGMAAFKWIYSNTLDITIHAGDKTALNVGTHPLFFVTRSPRSLRRVESLLLLNTNDDFAGHLAALEQQKQQTMRYFQELHYNRSTILLTILSSTILIVTNIAWYHAFKDNDAWALWLGITDMIYPFSVSKVSLARGAEYRGNIYFTIGVIFVVMSMGKGYVLLKATYILLGILHLAHGWWLYKHKEPVPEYV